MFKAEALLRMVDEMMNRSKPNSLTKVGIFSLLLVIVVGVCYMSLASSYETAQPLRGSAADSFEVSTPQLGKSGRTSLAPFLQQSSCTKGRYGCLESWLRRKGEEVECKLLPEGHHQIHRLAANVRKHRPRKR